MPLPKLSPPQSRFAAPLMASIMLLMLHFAFSPYHFASAAEIDSILPEDHNHQRLLETNLLSADIENIEPRGNGGYEAEFLGYDRAIIGRAPVADDSVSLSNNAPRLDGLVQGQTKVYLFPSTELRARAKGTEDEGGDSPEDDGEGLKLESRQSATRTVYISVNVCAQPKPIQDTTHDPPPQLQLYISQANSNTNPGPDSDGPQERILLIEGAVMHKIETTDDVHIGLFGVTTTQYDDGWNVQIAASVDGYYHTFHTGSPNLQLVDSDSGSALLVTGNLTGENARDAAPPYVLFASDRNLRVTQGLQNSYCGLLGNAAVAPTSKGQSGSHVNTSITTRGSGAPKQQFYVRGIAKGTTYNAALGIRGGKSSDTSFPAVVGGGGQVWPTTNFTTLSESNCALVYDLSFCDQTAYAVPANSRNFLDMASLASFYDNSTSQYYKFFKNALAQTPCNTTPSAQYSLARNCDDCAAAYKLWLCAVTIPRCTDFSSTDPWLRSRSMINPFPDGTMLPDEVVSSANKSAFRRSSRNPLIDEYVTPGPYKEMLPCDGLCYNIVQSCPSSMGFGCPLPGRTAFNESYATMSHNKVRCNHPGIDQALTSGSEAVMAHPLIFVALFMLAWGFM